MTCKTIAIANQKGGVGKTTTVANMSIGLARAGKKVLAVDFDSQGNLTNILSKKEPDTISITIATHVQRFMQDEPISKSMGIIELSNNLHLFPSNIELADTEVTLGTAMIREQILKRILAEYKSDYDYILIDTSPSLGLLTLNALTASDSVIIPVESQYLSAKGLESLLSSIGRAKKHLNPKIQIEGILFTIVQHTNHSKEVINAVIDAYGDKIHIFNSQIPHSVRAAEAGQYGKGIYEFDPNGKVAIAYSEFVKEVISDGRRKENNFEADR